MHLPTTKHLFSSLPLLTSTLAMRHATPRASSPTSTSFTTVPGPLNTTIRYKPVPPEICEMHPGVKSYAGYVDVSPSAHMFFWLFEARNADPSTAPLTAWISGGPGDSSMSELFTEHGPCRVRPDGESIVYNPFSWNNYSNVVYIDQPVQVGFSYTELVRAYLAASDSDDEDDEDEGEIVALDDGEECPENAEICGMFSRPDEDMTANSTVAAAPNFWKTVQGIVAAFPAYAANGFHFGSESYGGHYVPIFSKYILDQNARNIVGTRHIDLKSVLIGNGWFSPNMQTESYYKFGFENGNTYDIPPLNDSIKKKVYDGYYGKGKSADRFKACEKTGSNEVCMNASAKSYIDVQEPWIAETGRDNNDIRQIDPSPFPNDFYQSYLQLAKVREAIGANQTFIQQNPTVGAAFDSTGDDARELGILSIIKDLVAEGIRVTLYAGDADYECNWIGIESVADAIGIPGYDSAGYTDIVTPDNVCHGQVKQSGSFSFARVYEAGHAVGAFQPLLLQTLFARTLAGTDLARGEAQASTQYRSEGTAKSTYREGNGTVQNKTWPDSATYNYMTNKPTLEDFEPFWDGKCGNC